MAPDSQRLRIPALLFYISLQRQVYRRLPPVFVNLPQLPPFSLAFFERFSLSFCGSSSSVHQNQNLKTQSTQGKTQEIARYRSEYLFLSLVEFRAMLAQLSIRIGWLCAVELRLENYAVIDSLVVEFPSGLESSYGRDRSGEVHPD